MPSPAMVNHHYPDGDAPDDATVVSVLSDLVDALHGTGLRALLMGGIGSAAQARPRITDDIDEDMQDPDPQYPSTPYTRTRDIRSAAPTPDTAAIGRKFSFSFAKHFDEEDIEEEAYDEEEGWQNANQEPLGVREVEGKEGEEETEFAKWFWENRGDSNRAWKKRRRDVMKQKRQRENRRVSRRVV